MLQKSTSICEHRWLRVLSQLSFAACLLHGSLGIARAQQEPQEEVAPEETVAAAEADPLGRDLPRSALRGYLTAGIEGDYERAAEYLDLSRLSQADRRSEGPGLARQLKVVLDRNLWVDLGALADAPEGDLDDGLPPNRDRVGTLETARGPVDIDVQRLRAEDGSREWKISADTVAAIPALYEEFGLGRLGQVLPSLFFDVTVLQVQLWQWIALFLLVLVAYALSWYLARTLIRIVRPLVRRTETTIDDRLLEIVASPLRLLIAVGLFAVGMPLLGLAIPARELFVALEKAMVVVAGTWLLFRLIDVFGGWVEERLRAQRQVGAIAVLPLGRRTAKVVLGLLAGLALLQNLGVNVTALVAGLGVGGLALALGAQKTLENLFGGVTIIFDQPVRVGDFFRFEDQVGTVEDIGLRSTRVRTLDRSLITIPNADFSQMKLENLAKRDRIRLHIVLGLRYETTPDQLRYVLIEVRKLLYSHPTAHPDPVRVRFVNFGAFSLDVEIHTYIKTSDWNEFLAVREDIYLRIMDIVEGSGTGFAFPSQTMYMQRDSGVDAKKRKAAEGTVHDWREKGELLLPDFPQETVAQLNDTLDYPPQGSALREDS